MRPNRTKLRCGWPPAQKPASDYMAAKIPGARKVVIPNAGHAANIDQPQAFNDAVTAFLAELPAA